MENQQIVKKMNVNISSTENIYFGILVLKMTSAKSEINF